MWEDADQGGEPPASPIEGPEPPPPRRSAGVAFAALLAAAAAAGFGWWIGTPRPVATAPPPVGFVAERPAPVRYASAEPVPAQVRQAYDQVRAAYADGGAEALVRASQACAQRLQRDPRNLDRCLAFDVYAGDVLPEPAASPDNGAAWFHDGDARAVALARSALPVEVDASDRVAQVRALTIAVLPKPPKPPPAGVRRIAERRAAPAAHLHKAKHFVPAKRRKPAGLRLVSAACRNEPTRADRLICADRTLAKKDRRMKSAYDRAIASGVDPDSLAEDQTDWRQARDAAANRDAIDRLYRERIQDLEAQTPPH